MGGAPITAQPPGGSNLRDWTKLDKAGLRLLPQAAKDAFPKWRNTPVSTRARVMLKLQQLINENMVSHEVEVNISLPSPRGFMFHI